MELLRYIFTEGEIRKEILEKMKIEGMTKLELTESLFPELVGDTFKYYITYNPNNGIRALNNITSLQKAVVQTFSIDNTIRFLNTYSTKHLLKMLDIWSEDDHIAEKDRFRDGSKYPSLELNFITLISFTLAYRNSGLYLKINPSNLQVKNISIIHFAIGLMIKKV